MITAPIISEDIWSETPAQETDIYQLQAQDFQAWIRKQVRTLGRKAEVATIQFSAVEIWLQELGIEASFIAGGEVQYDGSLLVSEWTNIGYYMFDEDGLMELKAVRWLDIALFERKDAYLIAR